MTGIHCAWKGLAAATAMIVASSVTPAAAMVLIDGTTPGFYNAALGTTLDLTNPVGATHLFPGPDVSTGDPVIDPVPFEPDLGAAVAILGDWLGDPANLNANWSGPQAIPATWAVNSETAIVYEIDAGATGLADVVASFGVDNGIFVWLDGVFLSGELRPGGASLGEHVIAIGAIAPGTHYLQVLREDHGGATGYQVLVTGETATVPLPATAPLLAAGLALAAALRRRTE